MHIGVLEIDVTRSQYCCGRVKINTEEIIKIEGYEQLKPAFHGDKVKIELLPDEASSGRVVEISSRAPSHRLSGILYLNSRVVYGANKRGIPYFLFKPSDSNYPNCIVPSRLKLQMQKRQEKVENQYVVIDFNFETDFWDTKFPKGTVVKYLGKVGDLNVEYEQILYRWKLDQPNFNKLLRDDCVKKQIDEDLNKSNNLSRIEEDRIEDLSEKIVFSIDPEGCKDIDDAIHVSHLENLIEVGVHIADVSSWIKEGSALDIEAKSRMSTIYPPSSERIDMFPEIYSTQICSLVEGEERLSLSTILIFTEKGEFLEDKVRFVKCRIKSHAALSYNEAEHLIEGREIDRFKSKRKDTLFEIIKKDLDLLSHLSNTKDPHKIVEYFMVLVNGIVGKKLSEVCPEKLILRVHQGEKGEMAKIFTENDNGNNENENNNENDENNKLREHLRIISMNSAEYLPLEKVDERHVLHYGLGLKYYTHFTSPIRRYVDLINHRLVKKYLISEYKEEQQVGKDFNLEEFCSRLNDLQKRNNVAERQFKLIQIVAELEEKWENMEQIVTQGYVTDISEAPFITMYFPEYDFSKRIRLFHGQLDDLLKYDLINHSILKIQDRTKSLELRLLQKLEIKIIPNLQGETLSKKVKIQLLNKEFSDLLNKDLLD